MTNSSHRFLINDRVIYQKHSDCLGARECIHSVVQMEAAVRRSKRLHPHSSGLQGRMLFATLPAAALSTQGCWRAEVID